MVDGQKAPIGVLALQGDVREHLESFARLGVTAVPVKTLGELANVSGLVIPGGESTTIAKLADIFGLTEAVRERIRGGMPTLGTCAGLILLANEIVGGTTDQRGFGGLGVVVRRNAFGNQLDSFEAEISAPAISDHPMKVAFIRAPVIESIQDEANPAVEVLARLDDGRMIAARQGNVVGVSFHPELTGELGLHRYFAEMVSKTDSSSGRR